MKNEFQPITGPIKDLAWSPDNQRMVVVGEGREKLEEIVSYSKITVGKMHINFFLSPDSAMFS